MGIESEQPIYYDNLVNSQIRRWNNAFHHYRHNPIQPLSTEYTTLIRRWINVMHTKLFATFNQRHAYDVIAKLNQRSAHDVIATLHQRHVHDVIATLNQRSAHDVIATLNQCQAHDVIATLNMYTALLRRWINVIDVDSTSQ